MSSNTKIKLGCIKFTNCQPLNYTLEKLKPENIELIYGTPAELNVLMQQGKIDAAPVSSIEYLKNQDKYDLIKTACISSDGKCGSVLVFSHKELDKIKTLALPCDSAASIAMLKIIFEKYDIIYETHHYNDINENVDAALMIGDNALISNHSNHNYEYVYDLGELWKNMTGLPAVFGTWVRKKDRFNELDNLISNTIETGFKVYFNEIVDSAANKLNLPKILMNDYLTVKIIYNFTERHKQSLEEFEKKYISIFSHFNVASGNKLSLSDS